MVNAIHGSRSFRRFKSKHGYQPVGKLWKFNFVENKIFNYLTSYLSQSLGPIHTFRWGRRRAAMAWVWWCGVTLPSYGNIPWNIFLWKIEKSMRNPVLKINKSETLLPKHNSGHISTNCKAVIWLARFSQWELVLCSPTWQSSHCSITVHIYDPGLTMTTPS